jgi:uncharacterized membrane protein YkvA (DUF1232 family)
VIWILAGLLGVGLIAATIGMLAITTRLLPPGRTRELVGFLPNSVIMLRRLRANRQLPRRARVALVAALAYVASPVQLIPNFIPVIGTADDLVVVTLAVRFAARTAPRDTIRDAWPGDPTSLDRLLGPPTKPRGTT